MARILLIDDDELIRETLCMVLEDAGHQVLTAENGRVGLSKLEQHPVDLVISDLFMPDMEGLETMRIIRQRQDDIKIIVISGGALNLRKDMYLENAELLGADACLSKPFHNRELTDLVDQLLK